MTGSPGPGESYRTSSRRQTYARLSAWLGTHALVASLIVLFCSAFVRLLMVLRADPTELVIVYSDAPTYLVPAHSLIEQGAFLDNRGKPMFHRTPGYPTFLAGIMLLMGRDLRTVLITQTVILSFGPLVLYWLARRILPQVMAIIGGLIAAVSPWGAVLAVVPMSDGLFVTVITVIFLLMRATGDTKGIQALLAAAGVGCLTGVAVLVRPIWPLVILVPAGVIFCLGLKRPGVWLLLMTCTVCALVPVVLWKDRNRREAHFNGLSDVAGQDAWQYLAARVKADISGQNRHVAVILAAEEEYTWGLPFWSQELDAERWRRANAIFREHPFRTGYTFVRNAFEHMIHPSPDVLGAARLNFYGDVVALALLWGGLLLASAYALWQPGAYLGWDEDQIDRRWLIGMLVICLSLTLSSGILFAAGSRLRGPLEAIVPLLAAVGLVHIVRRCS